MKKRLIDTLEKPEKKIMIYALCDPSTDSVRYIGLTCNGFSRIRNHYTDCYNRQKYSAAKKWIVSLRKKGKIFNVMYLEYFDKDTVEVDKAEQFWISYFKMIGSDLLNHEKGGRSTILNPTTIKDRRSRSLTGIKKSEQGRLNIQKGQTIAYGLKIKDQFGNIFNSLKEASDYYGFHKSLIQKAIYGAISSAKGIKFERIGGGRKPINQIKTKKRIKTGRNPVMNIIEDQFGNKYLNVKEASFITGVSIRVIFRILNKEIKNPKKGLIFKYSETT